MTFTQKVAAVVAAFTGGLAGSAITFYLQNK
jgi:hypothetical protein